MIFVTGGAGFIGSNFILNWFDQGDEPLLNIDKITYAGNLQNLESVKQNPNYHFAQTDIGDQSQVLALLQMHKPRAVLNFAAESHVDRSINNPADFIQTNMVGTFHLLQANLEYYRMLDSTEKKQFRFLHVSTDEVYGSLEKEDPPFSETTAYAPNSPYAASKASSDHLVRAFFHTYGLPVLTINCSNNYGPFQFPEKLIPLMIQRALAEKDLPIYGNGLNVRDWIYVLDHCKAIHLVLEKGQVGETYNVGGRTEKSNIEVVDTICRILDELRPRADGTSYLTQKMFVTDRLGHDKRYAINCDKLESQLGWRAEETFQTGIAKTIRWYLQNEKWIEDVLCGWRGKGTQSVNGEILS